MKMVESLVPGLPGCPGCAARDRLIAELLERIAALERRVKQLEERLGQNSSNSHGPPSSDPPGTPSRPTKPGSDRKRGGQPGHEGTTRELLATEAVDEVVIHRPTVCERCNAPLPESPSQRDPLPRRHQVWELRERPCFVIEHQEHARTCENCGHVTHAEMPAEAACSCFGPRLAATGAFLTGSCGIRRRQVEEVFEDVLGVPISVGSVSNLEQETTTSLGEVHQEAGVHVREAATKNLDETGWKKKGKKCWLWACATAKVAFFVIHPSRGKAGFKALMGKVLKGTFNSDRWHIYAARARRARQICWSHLARDSQKLVDRGGESRRIGQKAKELAGDLFLVWNDFKTGGIDRETLEMCLRPLQKAFAALMRQGTRVAHQGAAAFCQNLLDLGPALWTFIRVEGVEPTNNHAERVVRRAVIWRKRSFGAGSDGGCRFGERVMTAVMSRR
ncbi:MAG: IS66 family transposase, partial [Armatimonadetes bacterium]|nr:IS66 family transposase [Armatimonadota bacterium]